MNIQIYLCLIIVNLKRSSADSAEEPQQFVYNRAYASETSEVFSDTYPTGQTVITEETSTNLNDLDTISTQFVEFHPQVLKIQPMTQTPRIFLESLYKKSREEIFSTTDEPDDLPLKVVSIKPIQRGVLDLLLPPSRVKTFKSVFDTVRRMLSYTFRK